MAGCLIDGHVYAVGLHPSNPCLTCDLADKNKWTALGEGASCNGSNYCDSAGECVAGCLIDGHVYAPGPNQTNPCLTCDLADKNRWTAPGEGASCEGSKYCSAGDECIAGCLIDGHVYAVGLNPANPCLVCDLEAKNAWTPLGEGASCEGSKYCNAG
ncbi:MAG: hypothetical protein FWD57_16040, partial [Polyangiaceae bacterium]|nr:hypothetical protein [Polyangiaceae bacterium]